ncbi:hypothetical protein ACGF7W_22895 [Streptomyces sp. NPDC048219]|uniref:hypothetical protein n=1 Tax=unclassified Streptomyces TaxID=2593676 RepID=UPI003413889D
MDSHLDPGMDTSPRPHTTKYPMVVQRKQRALDLVKPTALADGAGDEEPIFSERWLA